MLARGWRIRNVKWNWASSAEGTTVGLPGSAAVSYGYGGPGLVSCGPSGRRVVSVPTLRL